MVKFGEVKYGDKKRYAEYEWTPTGMPGDHVSYFLKVNGTTITDWLPIQLTKEFNVAQQFDFEVDEAWDEPSYDLNDVVEFYQGSTILFKGRITSYEENGVTGQQGVVYHCLDGVAFLENVIYENDGLLNHVINPQIGEMEYARFQEDVTVGEIIKNLLDENMTALNGIVEGYIQSELDGMDIKPPRLDLEGVTIYETINELLAYQFNYGFYIDPSDQYIHFVSLKKSELALREIDAATALKERIRIKPDIYNCITRVNIEGRREIETVDIIRYNEGGSEPLPGATMSKGWDEARETGWMADAGQDDPSRENDGKVYRYYQLSHTNILPNLLYSQNSITIMALDPNVGASGNWTNIGAKINLKTGLLKITMPQWKYDEVGVACLPCDIMVRYAYLDVNNPPEVTLGYAGTAYTEYGWQKTFAVYDPEYKVQSMGAMPYGVDADIIRDATGDFPDDIVGKTINGATITSAYDGIINAPGHGVPQYGGGYFIAMRSDTTEMTKIAQAIIDMVSDVQYIGEIVLDGLDLDTYQLGHKINIINTSDAHHATMEAPLRRITWQFQTYSTILNLTSGYYLNNPISYDELKRRLTKLKNRNKASAWTDVSVASGAGGGGDSGSGGGSSGGVTTHDHHDLNSGGDSLVPQYLTIGDPGLFRIKVGSSYYTIYGSVFGNIIYIPNAFSMRLGDHVTNYLAKPSSKNVLYGHWQ